MNRSEARAVAAELYQLMRKDVRDIVMKMVEDETGEWIGVEEASKILGCSTGTIYNNISNIPHTKNGRLIRFKKSELIKYMKR